VWMCLSGYWGGLEIMWAMLAQVPLKQGTTLLHDGCVDASEERQKLS
jgi:hypothetical protein